ncbi:hypothetical protein chiPu_0005326, partial [Chiloscyllium punctatum]|nr:hypothetical protein [Chiloscyllium punctatum]
AVWLDLKADFQCISLSTVHARKLKPRSVGLYGNITNTRMKKSGFNTPQDPTFSIEKISHTLDSDSHAVLSVYDNLNKENPDGQLDEDINMDNKSPGDFGTAFGTNDPGKPSVRIFTMEASPAEMKEFDSSCLEFLKPDNTEKMWIRLQGIQKYKNTSQSPTGN